LLKHKVQIPSLNSTRANILWATTSQTIEKLAGYLVIAVLTRTLLKSDLGTIFFALSIAEISATIWNFGSDSLLIRLVAAEPKDAFSHFGRILSTRLLNIAVGYVILCLGVWLLQPELLPVLALVAAYDYLEEIYFCFLAFFTGQKRQFYRLVMFGGFKVLAFGAISLTAFLTHSVFMVLWTYVFLNLLLVLVAFILVRRQYGPIELRLDLRASLGMMNLSVPFFLINFLTILHMRFDTVLVGLLLGLQQVAGYELGIKMMEVARFVVRPLHSVFFPVFSEYVAKGEWSKLRARFYLLVVCVLAVGCMLTIGMQLFGARLLALLFGPNYQESVLPAQILFLSIPMMYVSLLCTTLALSMHRERLSALLLGICVSLNLGLNFLLIPRFGTSGAAWATVVSQALLMILMVGLILKPLLRPLRLQPASAPPSAEDLTPPTLP